MPRCLVYGATGYTGKRVVQAALARGLEPIVAGRDAAKVEALAAQHGLRPRVAAITDTIALARMLQGVDVVLNAAGPFAATVPHMLNACLTHGVHYLDLSGEASTIAFVASQSAQAQRRGVMLMPSAGFEIVASDALSLHVARRTRRPRALRIGLSGLRWLSRGSAKTIAQQLDQPTWARRAGLLCAVPVHERERFFDYGAGPRASLAVPWGDVVAAYFSTGIDNITTYFEATTAVRTHAMLMDGLGWAIPFTPWQAWLAAASDWMGGREETWQAPPGKAVIVAEVETYDGRCIRARLSTPDVYSFTASVATALLQRVANGDVQPGFQTACRLYGPDYILSFDGVVREDL